MLDEIRRAFYVRSLRAMQDANIPFLVGGAFAMGVYADIYRDTKDLDLFIKRRDVPRALDLFAALGYQTQMQSRVWIAKAFSGDTYVDFIFSSQNGICEVDDRWFGHSRPTEILGVPVRVIPVEEMVWSKSFVMDRERYDGSDIAHILRSQAKTMDWKRVLERFDTYWPVLLSHLVLFRFIYPAERDDVPAWVLRTLTRRLKAPDVKDAVCRGILFSQSQYRVAVERWGYHDGRVQPFGKLAAEDIDHVQSKLPRPGDPA